MRIINLLAEFYKEAKKVELIVSNSPVGQVTGSSKSDFYVYEWFVVETGEIFYVGKGRGNRYKEYHSHAYVAERIRERYKTGVRFVGEHLTEEEAVELETEEMLRILNETQDRLTNRMVPIFAKRRNGYGPSPNTPKMHFQKAPVLWVSEIDEHYFDEKPRKFDIVDIRQLKKVYFIEKKILPQEIFNLYGESYEAYYDKVCSWLTSNGCSVIKTKFAKSVSAWIYIGDDDVHNYNNDQRLAMERLGRNIPVYHLLDLWHLCRNDE